MDGWKDDHAGRKTKRDRLRQRQTYGKMRKDTGDDDIDQSRHGERNCGKDTSILRH